MALTGRVPLLLLAGLVPVAIRPSGWTVVLWWVVVAGAVAADLALAAGPSRCELRREPPSLQVRLGESAQTCLVLENRSGRTLQATVRDAWQPSAGAARDRHTVRLAAGQRVSLRTRLTPTRRGDRLTDRVTVRSVGPLGLAARQRSTMVAGTIRALPPFLSRRHLASKLAVLRQMDGRSAVRTRGSGTEFDSLRDYVAGDDVRSIDWRATARRTVVVVRTWQPERDRRVVLVLDTSRTSAGRIADQPRLDAAMDAALLLGAVAVRAGDRVDLVAGDRQTRALVRGPQASTTVHQLVTAMAPLEPVLVEADWSLLLGRVATMARKRCLVVLLTSVEPAAVEESLLPALPLLTAHHRVVVASVADPVLQDLVADRSTSSAVYLAAAAQRTMDLRQRAARALGQLGVHVVDAPPDRLPVALTDHYLALKSHGQW